MSFVVCLAVPVGGAPLLFLLCCFGSQRGALVPSASFPASPPARPPPRHTIPCRAPLPSSRNPPTDPSEGVHVDHALSGRFTRACACGRPGASAKLSDPPWSVHGGSKSFVRRVPPPGRDRFVCRGFAWFGSTISPALSAWLPADSPIPSRIQDSDLISGPGMLGTQLDFALGFWASDLASGPGMLGKQLDFALGFWDSDPASGPGMLGKQLDFALGF